MATAKKKTSKATKKKATPKQKAGKRGYATKRRPTKAESPAIIITDTAIVISLSPADQRRAKECLAKSGKITFAVREHSTTQLPALLDNGKLID